MPLLRLLFAFWLFRQVTRGPTPQPEQGAPDAVSSVVPAPGINSKVYRYVWLVPVLIGIPSILIVLFRPTGYLPGENFYVVAAQIFPVLLVALAVEARMRAVWDNVPVRYKVPLVGAMGLGELLSIMAASGILIEENKAGWVAPTLVMSELIAWSTAMCLIVSFVGVYVVALTKQQV